MSANGIAVTVKPTTAIPVLATAKLRSLSSSSGMRGSARLTFCHHTKTPMMTRPVMMSPHTEIGPAIVPQS